MEEKTILSVRDLKVRFDTFNGTVHAVNGVNLDLRAGETLAVVGESGSGKSVSMLSLLGLLPRESSRVTGRADYLSPGALRAGTEPVDLLSLSTKELNQIRGKRIGMVFQDALRALNPVLSVGEQLTESLERHMGYDEDEAEKQAVELLARVGIANPEKRFRSYPHQFSGGMRQRAMIAIAIACGPDILVADEPTTALDVTIQNQIIELTKDLQKEMKMSVIWITHDLGVVAGIADRVMVMYAGRPVEGAPVDPLYETPRHPYTEGLLGAVPEAGSAGEKRLVSIGGAPPDLFEEIRHCSFAWRCPYVFDRCWREVPGRFPAGKGHYTHCFYDLEAGKPRPEGA